VGGGGVAPGGSWVVERQHGTGTEGSMHVHRGPPHKIRTLFFSRSITCCSLCVVYIIQYCIYSFSLMHVKNKPHFSEYEHANMSNRQPFAIL
jgi:hypothetical protein